MSEELIKRLRETADRQDIARPFTAALLREAADALSRPAAADKAPDRELRTAVAKLISAWDKNKPNPVPGMVAVRLDSLRCFINEDAPSAEKVMGLVRDHGDNCFVEGRDDVTSNRAFARGEQRRLFKEIRALLTAQPAGGGEACSYPKCNCPFDAPADPNWCAKGLPKSPASAIVRAATSIGKGMGVG